MVPLKKCLAQIDEENPEFAAPITIENDSSDSLLLDSLVEDVPDTTQIMKTDTVPVKKKKKKKSDAALDEKVIYNAKDSIVFDVVNNITYLYGEADVKYGDITLKADYIEYNFQTNIVFAEGRLDTAGNLIGKPEFIEGGETIHAKKIEYNFESKKGLIREVITQQQDGYLHAERTKKHPDDRIHMKRGKYTTCDAENPHFHLELSKAVVIPDDKIVSGPAFLRILNIPLPLGIPFAYLPNKDTETNGILIPTYGSSPDLGFFLLDGGYYVPFSDKLDMQFRADIYSKGSWGLKNTTRYKSRYKHDGNVNVEFNNLISGYRQLDNISVQRNFFVRWNHTEMQTARPNSKFSANVNVGTSGNFRNNIAASQEDFLQSNFQSNIGYDQNFGNKPFNLSVNLRHNQNTQSGKMNFTLPEMTFSVQRFDLPLGFLRKSQAGSKKWFERIGINYVANMKNEISVQDSLVNFQNLDWMSDNLRNGVQQRVSASTSIKILKHFTLNPSANLTELWYLQTQEKFYDPDNDLADRQGLVADTISGFAAARDFNFNTSLTTKVYGMYKFKKSKIKAIRHVLTPNFSFRLAPEIRRNHLEVFTGETDPNTGTPIGVRYSPYAIGIYGAPSTRQSGVIGMNIINNIEMKVRGKNEDGEPEDKKITLMENLNITSGYDIFRDSMNFQTLNINARTKLFNNFNFVHNSSFEPYARNMETGQRVDRLFINETGQLVQFDRMNNAISFSMRSKNKTKSRGRGEDTGVPRPEDEEEREKTPEEERQEQMIKANPDAYVDFNVPWNFSVNYNVSMQRNYDRNTQMDTLAVVQGITFVGDISINDKWKVSVNTGYDMKAQEFTTTQISLYRDLHCWEMSINWIPTGIRKSIMLQINVKAPSLQDLKYTTRRQYGSPDGGPILLN